MCRTIKHTNNIVNIILLLQLIISFVLSHTLQKKKVRKRGQTNANAPVSPAMLSQQEDEKEIMFITNRLYTTNTSAFTVV